MNIGTKILPRAPKLRSRPRAHGHCALPGEKMLNLALQGGGAHGAFTWGVLDRLLEDERIGIEGISATSAGAMNAAVTAYGLATGGRDGAKTALANFWRRVSHAAARSRSASARARIPFTSGMASCSRTWARPIASRRFRDTTPTTCPVTGCPTHGRILSRATGSR